MNTFFFTSSLCNAIQAEFKALAAKDQVQRRCCFPKAASSVFFSLSPSFLAADAAAGDRQGAEGQGQEIWGTGLALKPQKELTLYGHSPLSWWLP